MSIQFENPVSAEVIAKMREAFLDRLVASDDQTMLVDGREFRRAELSRIANLAKQPVTLNLHSEGEVVTLKDGTNYLVTLQGWRRIDGAD